jgi:hypothetical protein
VNIRKVPKGVISHDASACEDPKEEGFGYKQLSDYIDTVDPALVIIYNDPLVIHRFLDAIKYDKITSKFKLWLYLDQLYGGIAQPLIDRIDEAADVVYTFTEKWKNVYESYFTAGCKAKVRVMGHAADPDVFKPLENRKAFRSELKIPSISIVFLNCNRNTERKRLDLCVQGFVKLLVNNPSTMMHMVFATGIDPRTGAFYDIRRIFMSEILSANLDLAEFGDRVLVIDTSGQMILNDDGINKLYNCSDIGINTSDGEGFGLCQLEHLQTGAPQIVTSVGSYDFLNGCSITVPTKQRLYHNQTMPLGLFSEVALADDIASAMQDAINSLETMRSAVADKTFPIWSDVCAEFLEDILALSKENL